SVVSRKMRRRKSISAPEWRFKSAESAEGFWNKVDRAFPTKTSADSALLKRHSGAEILFLLRILRETTLRQPFKREFTLYASQPDHKAALPVRRQNRRRLPAYKTP